MRNAHPRFTCFPSVVCVGRETEVTITPRDIHRFFHDDRQYKLSVVGLGEDHLCFDYPVPMDYPCRVENGCLRFSYLFDLEQEYVISFCEEGKSVCKLSLYAVEEDLYGLRPLMGDLHSHSYFSDGSDGPGMTPADYREEGFDFFCLTDHNRMYPSLQAAKLYADIPLDLCMIPGEEIHTPGSLLHIVHMGGKESVCSKYIHDPAGFETAVASIEETLTHIPLQYRHRMALAVWSCQEARNAGGLAILGHPCWVPQRYNMTREFADMLFSEKIFDAFELMAGLYDKYNNMQVALWIEQLLAGNDLPVVGTSDSHFHDRNGDRDFCKRFTVVFAKENTAAAIMDAIRSGYSVAAELPPNDENDVRFYSKQMRLVQFCHFLYHHYFSQTWRLCIGEGILMRRYAEGEDVVSELSALAGSVEAFYKRFYGITPVTGLSSERLSYAKDCLQEHLRVGPETRGSQLYILDGGRNKRNG